jgi:hypothetical protein
MYVSTYKPKAALTILIPKKSGGERTINLFTLPAAAVSKCLYEVILKRNNVRFSPILSLTGMKYADAFLHGPYLQRLNPGTSTLSSLVTKFSKFNSLNALRIPVS